MAKYLIKSARGLQEVTPIITSAGAGDANKIVQTDSGGKLDSSLLPTGIGDNAKNITASEALSAGDLVNIWDDAGTTKVRLADNSNGRYADGFVISAVTLGNTAKVFFVGEDNNQVTGLTVGAPVYLGTGGGVTSTAPTAAGVLYQVVGVADAAGAFIFNPDPPITLD